MRRQMTIHSRIPTFVTKVALLLVNLNTIVKCAAFSTGLADGIPGELVRFPVPVHTPRSIARWPSHSQGCA